MMQAAAVAVSTYTGTAYINCIILSVIKTAAQAKTATSTRLFSKYAAIRAHTNPTKAETRLAVELSIAGNVIAARHA